MFGFLKSLFSGFGMPKPAGPPRRIMTVDSAMGLISESASWDGANLNVNCASEDTIRLVELPISNVEQCMLELRFQMNSSDVATGVYPEIWVKVEGFGESFSKGLNCRLQGTNGWTSCELPFYLRAGQRASLLKFNLVFEGSGKASLKDIELYSTPLES